MTVLSKSNSSKINPQELEQRVKKMYREVALHPDVSYHFEMGRTLAERLGYPPEILDRIPSAAIQSFAGVGYYFDLYPLRKGDVVVDCEVGHYCTDQASTTSMHPCPAGR